MHVDKAKKVCMEFISLSTLVKGRGRKIIKTSNPLEVFPKLAVYLKKNGLFDAIILLLRIR